LIRKRCAVWRLKLVFPDSESKEATEIERNKEEAVERREEKKEEKTEVN
jgi:hypothetical protein